MSTPSLDILLQNSVHEATTSEVDAIIHPTQIYTDGYLQSPIQYNVDQRFIPSTVTQQLSVLPDALSRDFASAVQININTTDRQGYPINMFSPVWDRAQYQKVVGPRIGFSFF